MSSLVVKGWRIEVTGAYRMVDAPRTGLSLGLTLQRFLVASYAYYALDQSVTTDEEYDRMARDLLEHWGEFDHRHKPLVEAYGDLEAGTMYGCPADRYPSIVRESATRLIYEMGQKRGRTGT